MVLALFASVMLVQGQVEQTRLCQLVGWQEWHSLVGDALGMSRSWYEAPYAEKERYERGTP